MKGKPWVLGLSCSHNGAACLLHGDEVVAAIQDERLLRAKRRPTTARFASYCIRYCLDTAGIGPQDLDCIAYSITRGQGPLADDDLFLNEYLRVGHLHTPVLTLSHHLAHAISAFAMSGVEEAAVLVVDGSGTRLDRLSTDERAAVLATGGVAEADSCEWLTYYEARHTTLQPMFKQMARAHEYDADGVSLFGSLGDMYGAVGCLLFGSFFDGPGKVMGLAPYGHATIPVDRWLCVDERGIIQFTPDGFHAAEDLCRVNRCDDGSARADGATADFKVRADVAASVQQALECALVQTVARIRQRSRSGNLCYAGGVALNSVANERIVREGGFDHVFIFPAAEDSGVAVGAAYYGLWHLTSSNTRRLLRHEGMGRRYTEAEIDRAIGRTPAILVKRSADVARDAADLLCDRKIVGLFFGRSEMGPRALGHRSILCDPTWADAKDVLNLRVKHREPFRPFAPVVLREHVHEWFDVPAEHADSPFMLRVWPFKPGKAALVPAVAHVDNTARVQTVTYEAEPRLHAIVRSFYQKTGVPMLLNTSFNLAGEPLIERPEEALWLLLRTELDCCILEDRIVHKAADFRTILEMRPRRRVKSVGIDTRAIDGPFHSCDASPATSSSRCIPVEPSCLSQRIAALRAHGVCRPLLHATVEGAWGDVTVFISEDQLEILKLIDGETTGHTLLRHRQDWTAAGLEATLADMYRASLIEFEPS